MELENLSVLQYTPRNEQLSLSEIYSGLLAGKEPEQESWEAPSGALILIPWGEDQGITVEVRLWGFVSV